MSARDPLLATLAVAALPALALASPSPTGGATSDDPALALQQLGGGGVLFHSAPHEGDDADAWSVSRPDGHAPIGVMGDHMHHAGEWMVSLRAMRMHMDGMRDGTDELSSSEVFAEGFPVTPEKMDMDMLMFGVMYAPSDDLTLMAMVPYLSKEMDHLTSPMAGSRRFTTESQGLGDIQLSGLYRIYDQDAQHVHLNLGLSAPTGSTDERDDTPAMADAKLPYPMQLGSGTWDLLPGVTYLGQSNDWSWGAQGTVRVHLGRNDEGYSKGDSYDLTGWFARRLLQSLSASLRLDWSSWKNIDGSDSDLNPMMVPTADPDLQGGDRLDLLAGMNWYASSGALKGHRLAFEFGVPVYQDLDGPQLETDWIATLGWQLSF